MNSKITLNSNEFQKHQLAFTHWIRHSDSAPLPDYVSAERMTIHRDLIFNNISSFIEHTYPVTQALLPSEIWINLIDLFFKHGQCDSPYYYDISLHFKDFVDQKPSDSFQHLHQDYPWLRELMQYEWMELYVDMAEVTWRNDHSSTIADFHQQASTDQLTLNTTCWILAYQYPVHTWSTATTLDDIQPAPTCLLIFRDMDDDMQIHPIHPLWAFCIEMLQSEKTINKHTLTTQLQALTPLTVPEINEVLINLLTWLQTLTLLQVTSVDQN